MLAGLGAVTAEESVNTGYVTTGHTTFIDAGTSFNKCFAGIAGALMQRVTWFNGATLFSRMTNGDGDTWMYAMEHFSEDDPTGVEPFDPSKETLYETGNEWVLDDENDPNVEWRVIEYYALRSGNSDAELYDPTTGERIKHPAQQKVYVYAVQVGRAIEDTTIGRDYNFVMVVDTCQFLHGSAGTVGHNTTESGTDQTQPANQHQEGDPQEHDHQEFVVDLFVGGRPSSVPVPADPNPNNADASGNGTDTGGGTT